MLLEPKEKTLYNFSIDAHLDLGGIVHNLRKKGQRQILDTYFLDDFRKAKLKLVIAAIFIESDRVEMALSEALQQIQAIKNDISSSFRMVYSRADLDQVMATDEIGILLSLEGLEPIMNHIEFLDVFYDLGVRAVGLTWSRRNFVADGSYFRNPRQGIKGGLTPFGIEVVEHAEKLGMLVDVSHLNDQGFDDVIKYTSGSLIASHSNSRVLNPIPRNLTDEQIKFIADRKGVIGVNGYTFIVDEKNHTLERLCDHIDHFIKVGGEDCVGFGFDLCDLYYNDGKKHDVVTYGDLDKIENNLLTRGYDKEVIDKVFGGNFYRLLKEKLPE
ncbi:membrane dipeptidase [Acidaminobacter sp. JC074]|uniref:dipeptidase n=1 Tax=Acidaminobacter sp. JC074 TaxID=2530199 RepID=UPI001F0D25FB|nr:membrane dipeptidase [Acidaminobacter sp. JC074]MCH4887465.1 membrane dipeptidase [Acidaminobacter sp. JC074]